MPRPVPPKPADTEVGALLVARADDVKAAQRAGIRAVDELLQRLLGGASAPA